MKIPDGRKPIGNKWVLKIKRDGRYCARLVCLGYTQVPGIYFQDNFGFLKLKHFKIPFSKSVIVQAGKLRTWVSLLKGMRGIETMNNQHLGVFLPRLLQFLVQ